MNFLQILISAFSNVLNNQCQKISADWIISKGKSPQTNKQTHLFLEWRGIGDTSIWEPKPKTEDPLERENGRGHPLLILVMWGPKSLLLSP